MPGGLGQVSEAVTSSLYLKTLSLPVPDPGGQPQISVHSHNQHSCLLLLLHVNSL